MRYLWQPKGALIAGLQYFQSIGSYFQEEEQLNKGIDLGGSIRNAISGFYQAEGMGEKGTACQRHVCHARAGQNALTHRD